MEKSKKTFLIYDIIPAQKAAALRKERKNFSEKGSEALTVKEIPSIKKETEKNTEIDQNVQKIFQKEPLGENAIDTLLNFEKIEQENNWMFSIANTRQEVKIEEGLVDKTETTKKDLRNELEFTAKTEKIENIKTNVAILGKKSLSSFALASFLILIIIGGISFVYKGVGVKGRVLGISNEGYLNVSSAIAALSGSDFEKSAKSFNEAFNDFSKASAEMDQMGKLLNEGSRFFPKISKISSGKNILEAGKHLSAFGKNANEAMSYFYKLEDMVKNGNRDMSLLDILIEVQKATIPAESELSYAMENMEKVKIDDLPTEIQDSFVLMKENLPVAVEMVESFNKNSSILADILGANGSRKYLFLFQNNSEIRATGGFIGSYGLLDINAGKVRNFFIDGIYNPDGQLKEKIIPPIPVQKMIPNWTLHDSNWFPDFPMSARKATLFYEKTGGPTVDGVIAITPEILKGLLEITGPIEMEEYEVTIDKDNFLELTQYEVEEGYDKEENNPKKILSDLAPKIFSKISESRNKETVSRILNLLVRGLEEKHVLLYSADDDLQKMISESSWSGEVLDAEKDYLSVINTNIGGHKSDAMIEESIEHLIEIQEDGLVIDTVTITRKHNGGNTPYEWWNKTNANYMRIYVPKGSELISAEGQTRESFEPLLDYEGLDFKKDEDVVNEDENSIIDEQTGTKVYDESDKTVFANWVYVEPQETVTVTYKYALPFRMFESFIDAEEARADSFSLIAQKQSGSVGSKYKAEIRFPKSYTTSWNFPSENSVLENTFVFDGTLSSDQYVAMVFEK